jgi:hypothetical protein
MKSMEEFFDAAKKAFPGKGVFVECEYRTYPQLDTVADETEYKVSIFISGKPGKDIIQEKGNSPEAALATAIKAAELWEMQQAETQTQTDIEITEEKKEKELKGERK